MKRNNGLWITLGIVFGCTLFIVSMIGAQSKHVRSPHQFSIQTPYGLKPWIGYPGRVFAGNLGRRSPWKALELSDEQKAQMREQFREFLVNTAEIWQELKSTQQDILPKMRKAPKGILTPEQLEKLRERRATARVLYELRAQFRTLLPVPGTPNLKTLLQVQTEVAEKDVTVDQERLEQWAQERLVVFLLPKEHLHQLQTLRL